MNLIDKDALIESLGIETDCYDCEHETIIYHCDLDPVTVCEKIIQAPVITVTTESAEKAIEVLKNAAWLGAVYSFEETEEAVKTAIRSLQVTSAQLGQRYTEEELRVFAHGISLSLLSKRSAQHWRYDEDTATEIEFLERLYEKVGADMRGEEV